MKYIKKTLRERLTDALITAFTFVAALSWKDTIVTFLEAYLPVSDGRLWSELIASSLVTVIVIVFILIIVEADATASRFTDPKDDTTNQPSPSAR
jgi:hypothetical protein